MVAPDSRLLKPRNINRLVLLLAFLAPLVYLFGTQFFALAGAHGEQVFAEPVYVEEYVEVDNFGNSYSDYKMDINSPYYFMYLPSTGRSITFDFTYNGSEYISITRAYFSLDYLFVRFYSSVDSYVYIVNSREEPYTFSQGIYSPVTIYFHGVPDGLELNEYCTLSVLTRVPSDVVSENNSAYTDYLFGNMFGEDNFLIDLGRESLKDNPKGFAPYGSLIKFLDDTVFHMSDNSLALMGYGYVYYCGHVVLLDLIAMILLFIPRIIAMVLEFVTKGVDTR